MRNREEKGGSGGIFFLLLLCLMLFAPGSHAKDTSTPTAPPPPLQVESPGVDLWNAIRGREGAETGQVRTQAQRVNADVLINTGGEDWRLLRMQKLIPYGGYFLLGVLAALGLLWLLVRKSKIPGGRSGKVVTRMSTMQRISHWFLAGLIGFMGLTGLILLFGRTALIPVFGHEAFSPLASASKEGHNLFGPLLIVAILLMLIHYIRHNFPEKGDLKWLLTLGGTLGKGHPRVGFFNAGEKFLYWLTIVLCVVLSASGLLLLFPYYQETADRTQLALIIHAVAALVMLAAAFAHIWMVRTVEGTIDAMTSGDVDENWARAHHARWYEKQQGGTSAGKAAAAESPDHTVEHGEAYR